METPGGGGPADADIDRAHLRAVAQQGALGLLELDTRGTVLLFAGTITMLVRILIDVKLRLVIAVVGGGASSCP